MTLAILVSLAAGCFDIGAPNNTIQFRFADAGGTDGGTACRDDLDCPVGSVCYGGACISACRDSQDCRPGESCRGNPPRCLPEGECLNDSDCSGETPLCHQDILRCTACRTNDDCEGGRVCAISTPCLVDPSACGEDDYVCGPCRVDGECFPDVCDASAGMCVACVTDGECVEGVCDPRGQCVQCVTDADCPGTDLARACRETDEGSECVGCVVDDDCGPERTCSRESWSCQGCLSHADCPGESTLCNPSTGLCYDGACSFHDLSELIELTVESSTEVSKVSGQVVVAPVLDTNGDGHRGPDDEAQLLVPLSPSQSPGASLRVVTVSGLDAWTASASSGGALGAAVGDIDGDGLPEVVINRGGRLVAHAADGSTLWSSGNQSHDVPNLFDVDRDGFAEVVAGGTLTSELGHRIWAGTAHRGTHPDLSLAGMGFAADLDPGGGLEVVAGGTVYSTLGEVLCTEGSDGYSALADLDGDDAPEIIVVSADRSIRALSASCALLWGPVNVGTGVGGGPPAVVDLVGDPQPELLFVAGSDQLAALSGQGEVLWTAPLEEASLAAGVSAADLNGDGLAEVLVSDGASLKILRGADGFLLTEAVEGRSTLALASPVVADIDGDGAAEVIVGSHRDGEADAIVVFGDVRDRWAGTRNLWNQPGYVPSGIGDDLTVPVSPPGPWRDGLFRAQATASADRPAPNLVLRAEPSNAGNVDCPDRTTAVVTVLNRGAVPVAAGAIVEARLQDAPEALVAVPTESEIEPGEAETITLTFDNLSGPIDVLVTVARSVSDAILLPDCEPTDNRVTLEGIGCP